MKTRIWAAAIIGVLVLPLLALGMLDPLEGGLALLLALVLGVAVRLLSKVPVPRLLWISMAVALALAVITIVLAVTLDVDTGPGDQVRSPLWGIPIVGLWPYRVATVSSGKRPFVRPGRGRKAELACEEAHTPSRRR